MKNLILTLKAKNVIILFICITLIFFHFFCYFNFSQYQTIVNSVSENFFNSFNNGKTNKDNNIFFVSNQSNYKNLGKTLPSLTLPNSSEYTLENGVFTFNLTQDFIIKCAGIGIVKQVGILENGLKFVEIMHSANIITRYENLKIVGVGIDYNLKNIHIIGTGLEDTPLVFKILKNNKILENYSIENGEIKWQN